MSSLNGQRQTSLPKGVKTTFTAEKFQAYIGLETAMSLVQINKLKDLHHDSLQDVEQFCMRKSVLLCCISTLEGLCCGVLKN